MPRCRPPWDAGERSCTRLGQPPARLESVPPTHGGRPVAWPATGVMRSVSHTTPMKSCGPARWTKMQLWPSSMSRDEPRTARIAVPAAASSPSPNAECTRSAMSVSGRTTARTSTTRTRSGAARTAAQPPTGPPELPGNRRTRRALHPVRACASAPRTPLQRHAVRKGDQPTQALPDRASFAFAPQPHQIERGTAGNQGESSRARRGREPSVRAGQGL
jgi:hypothetical protein